MSKPEPSSAAQTRVHDDWQVAYVWAFIVKFGLLSKIRGLECLDDFERCLTEPVANRPDDVLEGVCVRFMQNLRPTLRLDCTNIQHHLSKYCGEMLKLSPEFTVWDRPWEPHEEATSSCCKPDLEGRLRVGRLRDDDEAPDARERRNPLKQIEERGGGLFELHWKERVRLLRQLVDWQLTHAESVRERIKQEEATNRAKRTAEQMEKDAETSTKIVPIGLDRNKKRIWSLDDSARLYQSGNPFKRPCPLTVITSTRAELEARMAEYAAHGAEPIPKPPKGTGPKGKMTAAQTRAHRTLVQGIENERALAEHIRDKILPKIEAHEKRIAKAKRKEYERIANLNAAELRSTRTRRATKVINYRDLDEGVDDISDDEPRRGSRRREPAHEPPQRPLIPGERRSARQRGRNPEDDDITASEPASASVAPSTPVAVSTPIAESEGEYRNGYENGVADEAMEIE